MYYKIIEFFTFRQHLVNSFVIIIAQKFKRSIPNFSLLMILSDAKECMFEIIPAIFSIS